MIIPSRQDDGVPVYLRDDCELLKLLSANVTRAAGIFMAS